MLAKGMALWTVRGVLRVGLFALWDRSKPHVAIAKTRESSFVSTVAEEGLSIE